MSVTAVAVGVVFATMTLYFLGYRLPKIKVMRVREQDFDKVAETLSEDPVKGVAKVDAEDIMKRVARIMDGPLRSMAIDMYKEQQTGVNSENADERIRQTLAIAYACRMISEELIINLSMRMAKDHTLMIRNIERMRGQVAALIEDIRPEPTVEQFEKYRKEK